MNLFAIVIKRMQIYKKNQFKKKSFKWMISIAQIHKSKFRQANLKYYKKLERFKKDKNKF